MHTNADAYKDLGSADTLGLAGEQLRNGANFRRNVTDEDAKRRLGDNRVLFNDAPPTELHGEAFKEEEDFEVGMRQNMMDFAAHDANLTDSLDFYEFCALIRAREVGIHGIFLQLEPSSRSIDLTSYILHPIGPKELKARFIAMDQNRNGRIEMSEFLMFSLRDALCRSVTRVHALLQAWDTDGSGDINKKEFRKAIKSLGFAPSASRKIISGVVRDQEIDRCFEELDGDGSGRIDYSELNKKIREFAGLSSAGRYKLRRTAGGRKGAALSSTVKIDPHSESSVAQQLRGVLREHAVRVVDLFRDWDEDGNGTISKLEFAQVVPLLVMPVLGVAVSEQDMDELFSIFDPDGSGLIDYSELHELLQPRSADLDPLKLASNPWVARQVNEKLRSLDSTDPFALCMHTTSALSVRSRRSLPVVDQHQRSMRPMRLDEAHRGWMMPMKNDLWRETGTGEQTPFAFSSSVRPRRPKPPALIKIKPPLPRMLPPLYTTTYTSTRRIVR